MIIWLASYPRSGNTLLRIILKNVFEQSTYSKHDDAGDIGADAHLAAEVGHTPLGATWPEAYAKMRSADELFLVKTHDIPEDDGKAIYIVRDGRPVCRSFYHYLRDFPSVGVQFSVLDVVAGFTPFGSWGDHLDHWNPQHRPSTLLLKYEDVVANPAEQIHRLAEFTGLTPLHDWQNNFQKLHELNPRFFRSGSITDNATSLDGQENAIFFAQHGDWMRRLGYAVEYSNADVTQSSRKFISDKGREYFNLRERVFISEREVVDLRTEIDSRPASIFLSDHEAAMRTKQEQLQREFERANWERSLRLEMQLRMEDISRIAYFEQKQYALSLAEKNRTVDLLTSAVVELNTRLRVLLTSRFLDFGWKLGFGAQPYWSDINLDELTPLIYTLKLLPGSKSVTLDSLRRVIDLANRAGPVGNDMESALQHLVEKGFQPTVVLDVGSAKGYWSVIAGHRWPAAEFFMIDPLRQSEPDLQNICQDPRFHYQLVAVGAEPGNVMMNVTPEPDGSSLLEFPNPEPDRRQMVTVETLDRLLLSGKIKPPQLVKLDVQGFELRALDGGSKLFESAEVFIIEANLFEFMPGCPKLHELVGYMADRGFYPFDFAGFLRRPFQNDLGQVDIVFVRHDSPMVSSNRWMEDLTKANHRLASATVDPVVSVPTSPTIDRGPVLSVIICTKDPQMSILNRTLDSLDRQTLPKDQFELIIVDNNSSPPLDIAVLRGNRSLMPKLIAETVPGLSRARCKGIGAATGELFVFVDDDNFLTGDYLERAIEIAATQSRIGLFGGISEVEFEVPIPSWKRAVLPYLGIRDYGPEPITAFADHWGEWEPIGAGMVARRAVAEKFVEMYRNSIDAQQLGRRGDALLSGEDSLFARAAHRIGYSCSYQPALKLVHYIKQSRMKVRYLTRLMEGHGRSYVLLNRSVGKPTDPLKMRTAIARLFHRLQTTGRAGVITWFWDLGYAAEKRNELKSPSASPPVDHLQGVGHGV